MDSNKQGTMSARIIIFSDSVLGNTANDTAGFSSAKYIIFGWLWSNNFCYFVCGCVQNLKNTLKPFLGLIFIPPPPKNIGPDKEIAY